MEFNEKLQKLRKDSGMTQEELSQKLYISRTAVSKWESGRGFPNINALINISKVFNVPIDQLLSGEELLDYAQKDHKTKINKLFSLIFGILDLLIITLVFLPLYGQRIDNFYYTVSLLNYTEEPPLKLVYLISLATLCILGIIEVILHYLNSEKKHFALRAISLALHSIVIVLFVITQTPYVTFFLFILFLSKLALLYSKTTK